MSEFDKLPDEVKRFLLGLDDEDVKDLIELLRNYRRTVTVSWFIKWLILGMAGTFMTTVALGEAITKVLNWLGIANGK